MPEGKFFACRVLLTKADKLDYVVIAWSEIDRRHDVEVASKGFDTETAAEAAIRVLGGVIPAGASMYLNKFEEDHRELWCWNDERTGGASQTFETERAALDAWNNNELVFHVLLD